MGLKAEVWEGSSLTLRGQGPRATQSLSQFPRPSTLAYSLPKNSCFPLTFSWLRDFKRILLRTVNASIYSHTRGLQQVTFKPASFSTLSGPTPRGLNPLSYQPGGRIREGSFQVVPSPSRRSWLPHSAWGLWRNQRSRWLSDVALDQTGARVGVGRLTGDLFYTL